MITPLRGLITLVITYLLSPMILTSRVYMAV